MSKALNAVGFKVVLAQDLSREQFASVLKDFSAMADNAEWAVIYYAGHGIELGGNNYLVPVDAKFASDRDVSLEAVTLEQVLQSVEGASKLRLVILDACRDNPFAQKMIRSSGSRSIGRASAISSRKARRWSPMRPSTARPPRTGPGATRPMPARSFATSRLPGLKSIRCSAACMTRCLPRPASGSSPSPMARCRASRSSFARSSGSRAILRGRAFLFAIDP